MKRFHVHIAADDLDATIRFYSTVFGMPPTVRNPGYAKWMVEDPRINFAISKATGMPGIDHLGIQVDSGEELTLLREQVARAQIAAQDQPGAACCYARSDKYWTTDPQGIAWETFHTFESIPVRGEAARLRSKSCCDGAPAAEAPSGESGSCCA
ncbi:MAG: ArsI/CadI family heavy metal resistance metalloenzyme [Candidatus Binatia bacterium]